jgi:hypothetical protein
MPDSAPYWRGNLRLTGIISAAVPTAGLLIGSLIITIIIFYPRRSIDGGG